ncbi:hypothetical protein G7054_g4951 [Neopestalotiopsis clavispora]|nr:hypothetical protein G7054_g4951 [Neopestalotiopsis clavispora]
MSSEPEQIATARAAALSVPEGDSDCTKQWIALGNLLGAEYVKTESLAVLEEVIQVAEKIINLGPPSPADQKKWILALRSAVETKFKRMAVQGRFEEAKTQARLGFENISSSNQVRCIYLENLEHLVGYSFAQTGLLADLDEKIRIKKELVEAYAEDLENSITQLHDLAGLQQERFKMSKQDHVNDLEDSIATINQAVAKTPEDHHYRVDVLEKLSVLLHNRYLENGNKVDLDESIETVQRALALTTDGHHSRPRCWNALAAALTSRFEAKGEFSDIDLAVESTRLALRATPSAHPHRVSLLFNLCIRLGDRCDEQGCSGDLDEAIKIGRLVVSQTSVDHSSYPRRLAWLGELLSKSYEKTGADPALEEAIDCLSRATDATLSMDASASSLICLASVLDNKFSRTREIKYLDESVEAARLCLSRASPGNSSRARWTNIFAVILARRYLERGMVEDLETAITTLRQIIKSTPGNSSEKARWLCNLGHLLQEQHLRTSSLIDLDEAINLARQAADMLPDHHPDQFAMRTSLGGALGERFRRTQISKRGLATKDLDAAIDVMYQTIDTTASWYLDKPSLLNSLSLRLRDRFRLSKDSNALQEAIKLSRQAIRIMPDDHPDQNIIHNTYGILLRARYFKDQAIDDLEEAVVHVRKAVQSMPQDYPSRAMYSNNMGQVLLDMYTHSNELEDLQQARQYFEDALHQHFSSVSQRMRAAQLLLSSAFITHDRQRALKNAETAIAMLPTITPRYLGNDDKHYILQQAAGLASEAASLAIHAKLPLSTIVSWLEAGRGVLASTIQDVRVDVSSLYQQYPLLAGSFEESQERLNAPFKGDATMDEDHVLTTRKELDQRLAAEKKFNELLEEIRTKPGFDTFLKLPSENELIGAAIDGPVVLINISKQRCDALLIHKMQMHCVELPRVSRDQINDRRRTLTASTTSILEWLWDRIVGPILHSLGFIKTLSKEDLPRIWWIPTGPLIGFPLHAAGYHVEGNKRTALDRVISSYAISVRAILHTRDRVPASDTTTTKRSVTIVTMEHTTAVSNSFLEFAAEETGNVERFCKSMGLTVKIPLPKTKDTVLSALGASDIFHFAGHGDTEASQPLLSRLLLDDWKDNPLTVDSLLGTKSHLRSPLLAYLSACGSGRILHDLSVDENIHLTSAFQLAGFRHVVGTLWDVNDKLSADLATWFYDFLSIDKDGIDSSSISYALNSASRHFRDAWLQKMMGNSSTQSRKPIVERKIELQQLLWVPYVHYGI